ncbi:rhizobiocin/RTX toxin, partial [Ahrensia sp. R2A130]
MNTDGTYTYTPAADFNGTDTFTISVDDGNGGIDTATVTITVNPQNDAPTATDNAVTTNEDAAVSGAVILNDIDGDALTASLATAPSNGTVVVNTDGTYTYTPAADFNGTDTFTVSVDDGNGGTDTATVTITVNPQNDAPTAADDAVTTNEDAAVSGAVILNDI